jgi:hypothetical protein
MNAASVDNSRPWITSDQAGLMAVEIILHKRTVILQWSQFIYAEGSDDEVRLYFASHEILIRGAGLRALLTDAKTQHVSSIYEPARADHFPVPGARFIREIEVRRIDAN